MARIVVSRVMTSPTRVNSQNEIRTFFAACCNTIRFATELSGVAFPASVLVLATASHMKRLFVNDGTSGRKSSTAGKLLTRFDRISITPLTANNCEIMLP